MRKNHPYRALSSFMVFAMLASLLPVEAMALARVNVPPRPAQRPPVQAAPQAQPPAAPPAAPAASAADKPPVAAPTVAATAAPAAAAAAPTTAGCEDRENCDGPAPTRNSGAGTKQLCEDGAIGGEIKRWGTGEAFDRKAQEFERNSRQRILVQKSQQHRGHVPASDLTAANTAREYIFTFGFSRNGAVVNICKLRAEAAEEIGAYFQLARGVSGPADACSGSFQQMQTGYTAATEKAQRLVSTINASLEGRNAADAPPRAGATGAAPRGASQQRTPGLNQSFPQKRNTNWEGYRRATAALSRALAPDEAQRRTNLLSNEFIALWGPANPEANPPLINAGGEYSDLVLQIRNEKVRADNLLETFRRETREMGEALQRCASTQPPGGVTPTGDPEVPATATLTAPPGREGGSTVTPEADAEARRRAEAEALAARPPGATPPPPAAGGAQPPEGGTPPPGGVAEPIVNTNTNTNTDTGTVRDLGLSTGTRVDTGGGRSGGGGRSATGTSGGVTGFLSDNWMWLAGGAAVVGGGVYLYNKDKDRKKTENYWNNYVPPGGVSGTAQTTVTATATTTSTSGTGLVNTPAGSKLIIVDAISGVAQGQAMSKIDVALVGPNGEQLSDSNTEVNASCLTPNPCSLAGGKSVTTKNGKATFTSLYFNQADKAVRLQFSAPGFATVSQPNSFDVGANNSLRE